MNKLRYAMFAVTVFLALAVSAVNAVPVLADDGVTPPDAATVVTPPVDDGSVVTDPPPADGVVTDAPAVDIVTDPPPADGVVTDAPAVDGIVTDPPPADGVVTDAPAVDPAAAPATLPELLEQLPAGTDVIVTDANGDVVPLATVEAAEIVAVKDPLWCAAGVAPDENSPFCTWGAADLWELINNNSSYGQPYTAGVLWIEHGADGSIWNTVIDSNWTSWHDYNTTYSLTLQGGWSGDPGSTALYTDDPYSYFNTTIEISGWVGNITINNIVIDTSTYSNTEPYDDYALYVDTNGSITLNNVTVMDNINTNTDLGCGIPGDCIRGGAYLGSNGNVTINNSSFNNNEGDGLVVETAGTVTTKNLSALGNGGNGVSIDNTWASTAKAVTMKGVGQFNNNGDTGLVVYSNGAITISNVTALWNDGDGVYLNNTYGSGLLIPAYLSVTVSGTNLFSNNTNNGLAVYSLGAITVNNITATWNGDDGAYLDNCDFGLPYDCVSKSAKPVTVSGTNVFNHNGWLGLNIYSAGGAILMSNITASYNGFGGANADSRWQNYYGNRIAGAWTLTGYGVFNENGSYGGLNGWSYGPMILSNVTANDNQGDGGYLRVLNTFTLNGYGIFNNNAAGDGLHLQASSTTTLNNITANGNDYYGVYVVAWRSGPLFAGVTFKGTNTFNDNGDFGTHTYDGLHIETDGKITLNNVTANGNADDGADLCNYVNAMANQLCYVTPSSGTIGASTQGISLTGVNTFNDNYYYGLYARSNGAIAASNVTAGQGSGGMSSESGAWLFNAYNPLLPFGVTLSGTNNTFNGNWTDGLVVNTYGAILINYLTANNNGQSGTSGSGAVLDNYQLVNPAGTTITTKTVMLVGPVRVNGNYYRGLYIESFGAVSLGNITATDNATGTGVYIDNRWVSSKQYNVTISGTNLFSDNGSNGLTVYSYGAILANNLTANWNAVDGADLINSSGYLTKTLTLTGVNSFNWNGQDGLYFVANGTVTLSRVTANFNDQDTLDTYNGSGVKGYTNGMGTITLTCGFAYGNGAGYGFYLNGGVKLVTVKGWYSYNTSGDYFNGAVPDYFNIPASPWRVLSRNCLLP